MMQKGTRSNALDALWGVSHGDHHHRNLMSYTILNLTASGHVDDLISVFERFIGPFVVGSLHGDYHARGKLEASLFLEIRRFFY